MADYIIMGKEFSPPCGVPTYTFGGKCGLSRAFVTPDPADWGKDRMTYPDDFFSSLVHSMQVGFMSAARHTDAGILRMVLD